MPRKPIDRSQTDVAPPANLPAVPPLHAKPQPPQQLNRIRQLREQQGVSLRTAARRLKLEMAEIRRQDDPATDLTISQLLAWQEILETPLADLLVDPGAALSAPVLQRAQMIRVMKTVAAILDQSEKPAVQRMSRTLVDQLTSIMPELAEVGPWHSVGQRRSMDEYGRAAERSIDDSFFARHNGD